MNTLRHKVAMLLLKLATQLAYLARRVDDDLTGQRIFLPAQPEYEIERSDIVTVIRHAHGPYWVCRSDHGYTIQFSYQYLRRTGKVIKEPL